MVERFLYTAALYWGGYQWVGVWLGIKVIARWQATEKEEKSRRKAGSLDVWLIGNALSLAFGFGGAWIAVGHAPLLK